MTWTIHVVDEEIITTYGQHGEQGGRTTVRAINSSPKSKTLEQHAWSIARRKYLDKINKDGYKPYDKTEGVVNEEFNQFLTGLTLNKTDANNRLKPQKAFKGFPKRFPYNRCYGQPKLNGLRTMLRLELVIEGSGMFQSEKFEPVFRSMSGLKYVMPHITDNIKHDMFGPNGDIVFDGEFYAPGYDINQIRSMVPTLLETGTTTKPSGNPKLIGFVAFDLSMPDMIQRERLLTLGEVRKQHVLPLYKSNYQKPSSINVLTTKVLKSKDEIIESTQGWIAEGFEGSVIRVPESEYGFGTRSAKNMAKIKVFQDTECKVVDIILVNEDSNRIYINFVLQNDINDTIFGATPMGDEAQRKEYLFNKHKYIDKLATVKFYERSGVKKVPFHGNVVSIRPPADLGL